VVPETTGIPISRAHLMFSNAVSGVEKSIATLASFRRPRVFLLELLNTIS
jgi:hypothetical protein